jgi:hypothetical protein
MASFTILSKEWETEEKILSDLFIASRRAKFNRTSYYKSDGKLQIFNSYEGKDEVMMWDTFCEQSYRDYMKQYAHLEPKECNPHIIVLSNEEEYDLFRLATSDDSSFDHIAYDLVKEYLKMNPDKIIYEDWSEKTILLSDIEKIESEEHYKPNWYLHLKS